MTNRQLRHCRRGVTTMMVVLLMGMAGGLADAGEAISPAAQELIARLDTEDVYERQKAFLRLEALREPATAPILRRYVESRNAQTRAFSVRALAAVEGIAAVPMLLERVKRDRHPDVRVAALLAMEPFQQQDPAIAPALIAALRDRKPYVRMAAVDTVSRIDRPEARAAIRLRWKRERDRDVRRVLEEAMKRIGEPMSP